MIETQPPSRSDVRERLVGLLSQELTREDVADWAAEWVRQRDPGVADDAIWSALLHLSGADLQTDPGEYLHHEPDFHAWLDEFENADNA